MKWVGEVPASLGATRAPARQRVMVRQVEIAIKGSCTNIPNV